MIKRIYIFTETAIRQLRFVCAEKNLKPSEALNFCIETTYNVLFPEKNK